MAASSEPASGPMLNPAHPGEIVRYECLEPLGLTVTEAAKRLGVARKTLDNLVNARSGVSPEMAVRLAAAFGGSPELWITMQAKHDYAQVRQREAAIRSTVDVAFMTERKAARPMSA